jgi:type IV pilus assembly protein PilW
MHLIRLMPSRRGSRAERGFTLVELMIAVGLSLMILAGLVTVFVNNSNTRKEIERTTRQIENGRYATDLLSNNLMHAGFFAEFDPTLVPAPGVLPEACSTLAADIAAGLALPIQGYRNATSGTAGLSCLTDLKDDTDVVVVRRASTCVAGSAGCDALTSGAFYYFQASLCNPTSGNEELASATITDAYRLDTVTANLNRHRRTCLVSDCLCSTAPLADIRRYHTHIYFVANNSVGTDGVPTLKRAELDGTGFTIAPMVEGIENLKLEYGIDTNNDGMPETYTPTPDTYTCAGPPACTAVSNWRNVTSARIFLLARSTEPSPGYTNTKTYTLGSAPSFTPAVGDPYRRHVFNTTVKLANVAGRRGT